MTVRVRRYLLAVPVLFLVLLAPAYAQPARQGKKQLTLGILAFRPKPETRLLWEPVLARVNRSLPGHEISINVLTYQEMDEALAQHRLDFVLTNPAHYIEIRHRYSMTGVLATLVEQQGRNALAAFGGTIIARSDRTDLAALTDLRGRTISTVGKNSLGGYQAQAFEMLRAGIELPSGTKLITRGMPHDQVVRDVLDGTADAGFVRSGLVEQMAGEGKLDTGKIKIINRQDLPHFPYAVSTHLYPEWPFLALSHVDEELAAKVASALLGIKHQEGTMKGYGVHGFTVSADYSAVETLLRELRLPPFDVTPAFTARDVWRRYRITIITMVLAAVTIAALLLVLLILNRRLRTEQRKVRESEEKYRMLFDSAADAIIIHDTAGRIMSVNAAACDLYGYSQPELLAMSVAQVDSPEHAVHAPERIRKLMEEGSIKFETVHRRKDGSNLAIDVNSRRILWDGRPSMMSICRDITERKRAETIIQARLRISEYAANHTLDELLQNALDELCALAESPIGFFHFVDPDQRTLSLQAWSTRTLREMCTAEGKGHRYDIDQAGVWVDCIRRRAPVIHNDYAGLPHRKGLPKGHAPIIREMVFPVMRKGNIVAVIGVGNKTQEYTEADVSYASRLADMIWDITERKKAEEALQESERLFRESVEFLPLPIGMANADGTIRWYNKSFIETYGYTIRDIPTIDEWARAAYPDVDYRERKRKIWDADVRKAVAEQGSTPTREYEVTCKNGRKKNVEITMRPIGSLFIAAFYDVTARKRVEKDLMEKTLQLEDLTKNLERRVQEEIELRARNEQMLVQQSKLAAMGEMLGAIAHQWRQPLNALGLVIQNLRDAHAYGELDKAYVETMVEKSMAQLRHMSKTIDDFRNFFLPDKEKTDFDAMQAVGDVLALLSAQLAANAVDFRLICRTHEKIFTKVEEIIPCPEKVVRGFRNEFEHVIMNLINNARDAILEQREAGRMSGGEKGRLTFEFRQHDGMVKIEMSDNGGGIPEEILDRVFEPYFTTKGADKGTGVGLYMSKVIIEEHMQGRLSVRNGDIGAVFTIELPRV